MIQTTEPAKWNVFPIKVLPPPGKRIDKPLRRCRRCHLPLRGGDELKCTTCERRIHG